MSTTPAFTARKKHHVSGENVRITHRCIHCGDPCGKEEHGTFVHIYEPGDGTVLTKGWLPYPPPFIPGSPTPLPCLPIYAFG